MKKLLLAITFILSVSACATASKPGAMVPAITNKTIIGETSALRENVSVGEITGGKETNPLWTSEVSNEDFAESLRQSFAAHAMLALADGDYRLDAQMLQLKQPFAGFNMTVTSTIQYTLTNVTTGDVVLMEEIITPYTAKTSDAFLGVERLRLANEGAIRESIATLIEMMIAKVDGEMVATDPTDAEDVTEGEPQS